MQQKFHIERMDRERLELALDWAAAEGWNPGLHDAACFFTADPGGFFMGFLGDEPVGSISAVSGIPRWSIWESAPSAWTA
jgi:hypothetical protein